MLSNLCEVLESFPKFLNISEIALCCLFIEAAPFLAGALGSPQKKHQVAGRFVPGFC